MLGVGQVGSADPTPLHRNQHFIDTGGRVGQVIDPKIPGSVDDDGLHTASSSRTRSRPRVSGESTAETRVISE